MSSTLTISENGLHAVLDWTAAGDVHLLHFGATPFDPATIHQDARAAFRLVELQTTGADRDDHHGEKHTGTLPGKNLRYVQHADTRNPVGRKLAITLQHAGLTVVCHWQFYDGLPVIRAWTEARNDSTRPIGLEYLSSFCLTGLAKDGPGRWETKSRLHVPHNTWHGEAQWQAYRLPELGLNPVTTFSLKRLAYSNTGTWSAVGHLPMGCYENTATGATMVWQIENNGSWHWELSDIATHLYLQLSGPTFNENHWWKSLPPGESFTTVPVAIGCVAGGLETAIGALTRYRRAIRRPNRDNKTLPVIFNDYMNCLMAEPTTAKLRPLITAAAEVGAEYFCIDAGWYADGEWWSGVGEWLPSQQRFPGGIKEPLDLIRQHGMIPGLWLELEVMGIHCPLAKKVPDAWFFLHRGQRVIDHGRFQLDYRNPEVRAYADGVIDRLVREYGVGYIKMDYNIDAGPGTDRQADSLGDGLLQHNRAYLAWLDSTFARYPDLVIENCGSGGMRMDYALLSRHSIQSSSDQMDYRKNAVIAAACPTAVTPEQCAVWSYPLKVGDREEVIFNMVNALLLRIHQSGHLAELTPDRRALVKEALDCYKRIRADTPVSLPFWPLGLPRFSDPWLALGLRSAAKSYLAVWRLADSSPTCALPLPMAPMKVTLLYPAGGDCDWNLAGQTLTVTLPQFNTARLFEINCR
ncbi:MAG: hypothetical protein PCFJNLEI_02409 [Verrucomicrobiae bacterium]|nr:hypothetical protein [Verrucomicrobiae bacterium]